MGAEFWEELKTAMRTLEAPRPECGPVIGLPRQLGVRRKSMARFPYAIVFVESGARAEDVPRKVELTRLEDALPIVGQRGEGVLDARGTS